jgi:hypothetical protein
MKRFVDTELWHKEWYRLLAPAEKCAWAYMTNRCDNVGVVRVDRGLADYLIGTPVDWDALPGKVNGNLEILPNGKFWLVDFCEFQYGELYENNRPHLSYIALLRKHGLYSRFLKTNKGLGYPLQGVQDKIRLGLGLGQEKDKKEDTPCDEPFAELHKKFNGGRAVKKPRGKK